MKIIPNCTECNQPGGTVPHYYDGGIWVGEAMEMMHEECALARIERYMKRKELESLSPN